MIRRVVRAFAALGLGVALYLAGATLGAIWPNGARHEPDAGAGAVTVHLLTGPIHTDILLPADAATRRDFAFAAQGGVPLDLPGVAWIVVGWGSQAFYTATGDYSDLRLRTVWQAATGDASVLRVSVAGDLGAAQITSRTQSMRLSAAQYARLRAAVLSSFSAERAVVAPGFSDYDRFFEARGRFHLWRTCNVWVADTLEQAGVRFGRWTPVPFSIRLSHWWFQTRA